MTEPLRFAFGAHLHQPVGNFDHIVEQHVREAYRPFLERLDAHGFAPVTLHVSGPLLEWLEAHDRRFLDYLGRLVSDGKIELLLAGYDEPILAALPRPDRVQQIAWMREALLRLFGPAGRAEGLWLTERVWDPDLAADLAAAGVRYCLVDDRHFLVSGFPRDRLHMPYWTEGSGGRVALFPIDERLRYLVPFKPPAQILGYLEHLRAAGHRLVVLADDGEKFGGWPGTHTWVYERGWLDEFLDAIRGSVDRGELRLVDLRGALAEVPSGGLAYLPSASYREMEKWALPPDAALHLDGLERELGEHRMAGPDGALVRGSHWLNFLARYPEANRMHKKMVALSSLARSLAGGGAAGSGGADVTVARRAIGRAQCNDAYWHGVFGGLYLPHLRDAVWRNLAIAERELRRGEPLVAEVVDFDGDGRDEIWVHCAACSVLVAPARGGAVEEYTRFDTLTNHANVLTRRREAYHDPRAAGHPRPEHAPAPPAPPAPPVDADDRALFVDRILAADLALESYAAGRYAPLASWARAAMRYRIDSRRGAIEITLDLPAGTPEKVIRIAEDGTLAVSWRWDVRALPDGRFAPEISLASAERLRVSCEPAGELWRFPIETVAKSERGLEATRQGESLTPLWPVSAGAGRVTLTPADP